MSKLLDSVSAEIKRRNYSYKTDQAYRKWIKNFIIYNGKRHPSKLGAEDIKRYLSHLALERNLSPSSQNLALNAIVFLYKNVLKIEVGDFSSFAKAKYSRKIPVVFSKAEAMLVLSKMTGVEKLVCSLLYGSGLRLMEALRIRMKDIDFEQNILIIPAPQMTNDN
jgi:site-specific recombinase XerD